MTQPCDVHDAAAAVGAIAHVLTHVEVLSQKPL